MIMRLKCTLLILFVFGLPLSSEARTRTVKEALTIAQSFFTSRSSLRSATDLRFDLVYTGKETSLRSDDHSSEDCFYVFNTNEDKGFVIVSAEDRVSSVLGYSLDGAFAPDNLPDNARGWLEGYIKQITYARSLPEEKRTSDSNSFLRSDDRLPQSVEPMIRTKWDQEFPYNQLCPLDDGVRSLTGCGATAMAQILNYHRLSEHGRGKVAYQTTTKGFFIEEDMGNYLFDWKNMSETYDSSSTADQKNAVAKLMYAAGVSQKMDYSGNASGSYDLDIPNAFVRYFNYDKNAVLLQRTLYYSNHWITLLKTELAENRPVFYAGTAYFGRHFFVCDGYDTEGLFHINWGWGGNFDGFFQIDLLNAYPNGFGMQGFSYDQSMAIGIQKPTDSSREHINLGGVYDAPKQIAQGDTLKLEALLMLESSKDQKMKLGWGIYEKEQLIKIVGERNVVLSPEALEYTSFEDSIPSFRLPAGSYTLKYLYCPEGEKEWREVSVSKESYYVGYLQIVATESTINMNKSTVVWTGTPLTPQYLMYKDYANEFTTVLHNHAETALGETVSIDAYSLETGELSTLTMEKVYLSPNEKKDVSMNLALTLEPGKYLLAAYIYDKYYGIKRFIDGTGMLATVFDDNSTSIEDCYPEQAVRVSVNDQKMNIQSRAIIYELYLFDSRGALRSTNRTSGTETDVSIGDLPSGIYFLRVKTGEGWINKKVGW